MDPTYNRFPAYISNFGSNPMLPDSSQFRENQFNQLSTDSGDLVPPAIVSHGAADSYDDEAVFKYLNQMLMEEDDINIEPNHIMSYDPMAFRVTERSFYDVLGQQYPVTPTTQQSKQPLFADHPNEQPLYDGETISDSTLYQLLAQNMYMDSDFVQQFQRGLEQATKFLHVVNPLVIDLESSNMDAESRRHAPTVMAKKDRSETMNSSDKRRVRRNSPNASGKKKKWILTKRGRKHHEREDVDSDQARRSKQSAIYIKVQEEEDELSELFDKVLLFKNDDTSSTLGENVDVQNDKSKSSLENEQLQISNGGGEKSRAKKQSKKKKKVHLRKLLILCAQAVSTNDFKTSAALLTQIRHHSSPNGDGCEKLAHYFANGLETRMVGVGVRPQVLYNVIASKQTSLEQLKIYQHALSTAPNNKVLTFFMNTKILEMAESATTLHIIDFGIRYGFQWPIFIRKLSERHGGPPKLRITGIDVPQDGFRPTEWIEDTGRRLARYCLRFKVPFEFNAIASQHWESIKVEDLKVQRNEKLAVNCMCRFKNLMDETVEESSPRDSVLKLIRSLKPDIFVHSINNGNYNSPFFFPRFREALFYYSALFDLFDTTPDCPERFHFEAELFGMEAMNVIACEGADRNVRPETYAQWQVRTQRACLKMLALDSEITKSYGEIFKEKYHKYFKVKQVGDWLLLGWKGRIFNAASCWVPS